MTSARQAMCQFTLSVLDAETTLATLTRIVEHGFEQLSEAQNVSQAPLACAAGCAFCCYHPVDLTAPEAFVLAEHLRTAFTETEFAAMISRLAANAERIQRLSHDEHALAKIPCALLRNGQCSVYAARPFACRAWHSMSAARCEAIFTHGDPLAMIPPLDMDLYNAQWDIVYGIAEGLRQVGLDDRPYELHSMLYRALTTPDAAWRWLQGEEVFEGCTPGAFFD